MTDTVKRWCETCEGDGYVFQEPQAGCHVGREYPCPDCDGNGYWVSAQPPAASQPDEACNKSCSFRKYTVEYSNVQTNEAVRYQKRIRELERIVAAQPPAASQPSPWDIEAVRVQLSPSQSATDAFDRILSDSQPPAASLAQAVKAGLAKRFPDDPPMEIAAIQPPAASQPSEKVWPFAESPGDFTKRLLNAYNDFDGNLLSAVRYVLIENPARLAVQPPAASQPTALSGEGVSDEQIACWVQESQSVCWSDTEQARYVIERALAAVQGKK